MNLIDTMNAVRPEGCNEVLTGTLDQTNLRPVSRDELARIAALVSEHETATKVRALILTHFGQEVLDHLDKLIVTTTSEYDDNSYSDVIEDIDFFDAANNEFDLTIDADWLDTPSGQAHIDQAVIDFDARSLTHWEGKRATDDAYSEGWAHMTLAAKREWLTQRFVQGLDDNGGDYFDVAYNFNQSLENLFDAEAVTVRLASLPPVPHLLAYEPAEAFSF